MLRSSKAKTHLLESKTLVNAAILIITFMLITGCLATNPVTEPVKKPDNDTITENTTAKKIYAPVVIPYVIENPIEIVHIDDTETSNHQRSYFQINGLLDKVVENKINKEIKELYETMVSYATGEKLVPFRGVMSVVTSERKVDYSYLSVVPAFNSNNILSVGAHLSGAYNNPDNYNTNFSMIDSLNLDLNTGESFVLQDVFTDDVNGLGIVNDTIAADINRSMLSVHIDSDSYYSQLTLVAPFKGVSEQQKFFLNDSGINVVIDHNNPEFSSSLYSNTIIIPYFSTEGHIAITERFIDLDDEGRLLYRNQATKQFAIKRFLNSYHSNVQRESDSFTENGTAWYVSYGYPGNFPDLLVNIVNNIRVEQQTEITTLAKKSPINYAEQNVYAYRMGRYVNVSTHLHYTQNNNSHWLELNYVYAENGERVQLAELFVDGYDYERLIKEKINSINIHDRSFVNLDAEAIMQDISFTINDMNISFTTKPYEDGVVEGSSYPLHFSISYQEIGQDNLTIFR